MQPLALVYATTCILFAAIVRGYSGFGFSMLSITALSIFLPPNETIPSIFILEVAASIHLLVTAWRDVHWRSLTWLSLGCVIGTPLGVAVLASVPQAPLTLFLAAVVLIAAVLLARGYSLKSMPGRSATIGTGVTSGVLNGSIGIGGPPVIIFYFGSPAGVAVGRASMIAYFLITDVIALAWQWSNGLLNRQALSRALLLGPVMLVGVWLGNRSFAAVNPEHFRRWILRLLMFLAVLAGGRAVLQLA